MSEKYSVPRLSTDWILNWRVASIGIFLLGWQLFAMNADPHVFPGILEVLSGLASIFTGSGDPQPIEHISVTLLRVGISFVAAISIGVSLGILMGTSSVAEDYFSIWALLLLTFPAIVWAFLGVLWWGFTSMLVPVFVATVTCIPFAIFNTWEGMRDVDSDLIEMANSFSVSRYQLWRNVYIPHLMPYIFSAMRITISVGWKVMLIAEIFGAQKGVGFIINEMFLLQRNDMIIVWALPPMILIFLFERGLKRIEDDVFDWRPDVRAQASFGE